MLRSAAAVAAVEAAPAQRRTDAAASRHEEGPSGGDDDGSRSGAQSGWGSYETGARGNCHFWRTFEPTGRARRDYVTEEDSGDRVAIKGDGPLDSDATARPWIRCSILVNRILARRVKDAVPITVDTGTLSERCLRQLHPDALRRPSRPSASMPRRRCIRMPPRDPAHRAPRVEVRSVITTRGDGFPRVVEVQSGR